jgi:hypothetical protein
MSTKALLEHKQKQFELARNDLEDAREIYRQLGNQRGIGTCHLRFAYLYLADGQFDLAVDESKTAYGIGQNLRDHLLLARARILQCQVVDQRAKAMHRTVDDHEAREIRAYAEDALANAEKTQNFGILASAYIAMGFSSLCGTVVDTHQAEMWHQKAAKAIDLGRLPFLKPELQLLLRSIVLSEGSKCPLFEWLANPTGRTLDSLTDEIYRVVWKHENGKVLRIAKNLGKKPETVAGRLKRLNLTSQGKS